MPPMPIESTIEPAPIRSLGEWPGLVARYRLTPAQGQCAQLAIALRFDPDAVAPPDDPQPGGSGLRMTRDAWAATLDRYRLISDQLGNPDLIVEAAASLLGETPVGVDPKPLIAMARQIADGIAGALADGASTSPAAVPPAFASIALDIPFSAIAALDRAVAPLRASMSFRRRIAPAEPSAEADIPASATVTYRLPPDLADSDDAPSKSAGSLAAFAASFEAAFLDFDGAGGRMTLASGAGVGASGDAPCLWFVRWSERFGASVTLKGALVFFALAPLAIQRVTGEACGQTWSGIDLDAWARDFLTAFDAHFPTPLAVQTGRLDLPGSHGVPNPLAEAKRRLARAIKGGLAPLLVEQAGQGDLAAAQDRFEEAMLVALGNAFSVTTVVQIPAHADLPDGVDPAGPGGVLRLAGAIGPQTPLAAGLESACALSDGELDMSPGDRWITTLLTVARPERQARITLPLEYRVDRLRRDPAPGDADAGEMACGWLTFASPAAPPLRMPIAATAALPTPLLFQPMAATLREQAAIPPQTASTGTLATGDVVADALRWIYRVELGVALSGQDTLCLDVAYGLSEHEPRPPRDKRPGKASIARQPLFERLAAFRIWYADAAPRLSEIAFSPTEDIASPMTGDLIDAFLDHAVQIAEAWEAPGAAEPKIVQPVSAGLRDRFRLRTETAPDSDGLRLTLRGKAGDGGPPAHWPSLSTADGQDWASGAAPVTGPVDGWFEASRVFEVPPALETLTLTFGPLDVRVRRSATLAARVTRNADLMEGFGTAESFVLGAGDVAFPMPTMPLIDPMELPLVTPGPTLEKTLNDILSPLAAFGTGTSGSLRLSVAYRYAVAGMLASDTALSLTEGAALTQPDATARSVARGLAKWFVETAPPTEDGGLVLTITVLEGQDNPRPLVKLDAIVIPTADLPPAWWTGGSP